MSDRPADSDSDIELFDPPSKELETLDSDGSQDLFELVDVSDDSAARSGGAPAWPRVLPEVTAPQVPARSVYPFLADGRGLWGARPVQVLGGAVLVGALSVGAWLFFGARDRSVVPAPVAAVQPPKIADSPAPAASAAADAPPAATPPRETAVVAPPASGAAASRQPDVPPQAVATNGASALSSSASRGTSAPVPVRAPELSDRTTAVPPVANRASLPASPQPVAPSSVPPPAVSPPSVLPGVATAPPPAAEPSVATSRQATESTRLEAPEPIPTALPPAPTPAPPPRAAVSAPVVSDESAVRALVDRYRSAYSSLDVDAARAVWPKVDRRALSRAFDQLAMQEFDFAACDVSLDGDRASVGCSGNARYVPKVGNKTPRVDSRVWEFDLQKVDQRWRIESVVSR